MTHHQPAIEETAADEQPAVEESTVHSNAVPRAAEEPYEPIEASDAAPFEELPARPRRRVLAPVPVALLLVLMTACGFLAGVRVEKGQASSAGAGAAGGAAGVAARRGAGAGGNAGSRSTLPLGAGGFSLAGRGGGANGAVTVGEVTYVRGDTLYVTDSQGTTKKITTSAASRLTRSVSSSVHGIHPGETVIVQGSQGRGDTIAASSVAISPGGSGNALGSAGASSSGGEGGSAAPQKALFGE